MNGLADGVILENNSRKYSSVNVSRIDKSLSLLIAVFVHAVIFILAGFSFVTPPQFGMDKGLGSIEVSLEAASTQIPAQVPTKTVVETKSDFMQEKLVQQAVAREISPMSKGKDQATIQSTGGAITNAKPNYLKNPAPVYPEAARRKKQEGTVVLTALIDKNGYPSKVAIEESSGHALLDQAAFKAVVQWRFYPAMIGSVPIESSVRVPIRFDLVN